MAATTRSTHGATPAFSFKSAVDALAAFSEERSSSSHRGSSRSVSVVMATKMAASRVHAKATARFPVKLIKIDYVQSIP
ncbi:hypothetical protein VOM14_22180 [Paraburkholderia sp. MPAMCS5]|uniref:hypothetical protein n=1 Tax=Paraburkholderia sp. MPAMCS5 TaxID=3112563 RepID=UPI002E18D8F4|nr:hypothetical protein [Paraburkholderia sp. MPAMCS5]